MGPEVILGLGMTIVLAMTILYILRMKTYTYTHPTPSIKYIVMGTELVSLENFILDYVSRATQEYRARRPIRNPKNLISLLRILYHKRQLVKALKSHNYVQADEQLSKILKIIGAEYAK